MLIYPQKYQLICDFCVGHECAGKLPLPNIATKNTSNLEAETELTEELTETNTTKVEDKPDEFVSNNKLALNETSLEGDKEVKSKDEIWIASTRQAGNPSSSEVISAIKNDVFPDMVNEGLIDGPAKLNSSKPDLTFGRFQMGRWSRNPNKHADCVKGTMEAAKRLQEKYPNAKISAAMVSYFPPGIVANMTAVFDKHAVQTSPTTGEKFIEHWVLQVETSDNKTVTFDPITKYLTTNENIEVIRKTDPRYLR